MKTKFGAALVAGGLALSASAAMSQEMLVFGLSDGEQHPLNHRVIAPWIDALNADNPDALQVEVRYGSTLVGPANFYDRVMDDVVQIVWGITAFDAGRFPRTLVSTLPFMVPNAELSSTATCALYEQGTLGAEMEAIVPLLFVGFPQAALNLNNMSATSLDDMNGRKILTGSPVGAGIIQAYGGAPMSIRLPEQYEALQRGTADGTLINFTAFPSFRLHEVTTNHYVFPGGGGMGLVFMTRERWDALPEDARAVLERHSTCDVSRVAGERVDEWEAGAMAMVASQPGHTITHATPEQIADFEARVGQSVIDAFAGRVEGGVALVEAFRVALEEAAAAE